MPVMMFAILFGLSMDYEVFLISRIREEYLKDGDTRRAVADGLAKTARVITAAAAIMVVVFLAFLAAPDVFLKLFGIGLASAIFLDATLVRMVLVPAVMQLLGDRNWWIPSWLERILPRLDVEPAGPRPAGHSQRRRAALPAPGHWRVPAVIRRRMTTRLSELDPGPAARACRLGRSRRLHAPCHRTARGGDRLPSAVLARSARGVLGRPRRRGPARRGAQRGRGLAAVGRAG